MKQESLLDLCTSSNVVPKAGSERGLRSRPLKGERPGERWLGRPGERWLGRPGERWPGRPGVWCEKDLCCSENRGLSVHTVGLPSTLICKPLLLVLEVSCPRCTKTSPIVNAWTQLQLNDTLLTDLLVTSLTVTRHYQLLKMIILNWNFLVLFAKLGNIFQYSASSAGRIVDFSVFAKLSWEISIGAANRAIRNINSTNTSQPGRKILDVPVLEIDNVYIVTWVRIYGEI